ncbi:MAG: outer membrane beta-barrel protein [Tabrizicola sp.]|uniref:outer membrane protein n=1 Tax=Tabrizicola sp. TaxID=2005166 RepID=UPI002734F508|nr:outer membrane beta-barrel protein [Tabrizicola sp.]MDP3265086.1 outer membrane beta-barrel protein [Tabrizicola sp.]MDP3646854.1 outer membrane beta-barrel protein [Paracoccaceae bacterium]MDZ4067923.1 outer membrane beta-barrel protein [Tabrizicola sp.]
MKIVICALPLFVASASIAVAGGPAYVAAEPMPAAMEAAPAAVHDWSGFYGGLSYGKATGETNYYDAPGSFSNGPWDVEGNLPGLFAGYNIQNGNLVYGAELNAMFGDVRGTPSGFEEQQYEDVIDLKARLGYAVGSALFYGALGYSTSQFAEDGEPLQSMSGLGYGVGVDFAIAGRYSIGAEYYSRDLNGTLDYAPTFELDDSGFDTLTVRFGMQF